MAIRKSTIAIIIAVLALITVAVVYFFNNDDRVLLLLTNQDVAEAADIRSVDYIPEENSYFAFIDFELPENVRDEWLLLSYRVTDCEVFNNLEATGNLKNSWSELLENGTCYENKVLIRNPLASYNEVGVVVDAQRILLYSAGIDDPAFFISP